MRLHHGRHAPLEDAADELIRQSLKGVTKPSDKGDILTPWKENDRRSREVYVPSGTPDVAHRAGAFHRAINTKQQHLNSATTASLREHVSKKKSGSA